VKASSEEDPNVQVGVASWYGPTFHGEPTTSGEIYDQNGMTAAHQSLPMNTVVKVTHLENQKEIEVRINDRGPFAKERIIDLSRAAAEKLDMLGPGTAKVKVEVLEWPAETLASARNIHRILHYTIQVGSYLNRENAEGMEKIMKRRFRDVALNSVEVQGTAYYRIEIGDFTDRQEALEIALALSREGLHPIVIEKE
jgi:rare lipoprotein A